VIGCGCRRDLFKKGSPFPPFPQPREELDVEVRNNSSTCFDVEVCPAEAEDSLKMSMSSTTQDLNIY
jgi:hypothetical protein